MFGKLKDIFGGMPIGALLRTVPQSNIDETSQVIDAAISAKLQSVYVKEGETAAALIIDAGDKCMINIVTLDEKLSVVEMKERFSVNELTNIIVEALRNGRY